MGSNAVETSGGLAAEPVGPGSRRALVVADEPGMRHSLQRLLRSVGFEVHAVRSGNEALPAAREGALDVVLMDIQVSGLAGLETFRSIHTADPKLPVVLITAYGTAELAIQAMQMGAYDYVLKPFDVAALQETVTRAAQVGRLNRTRVAIETPPVVDPAEDRIVGINLAMQEVYKRIGQVAATDVPVLIRGETGTGKELVARAVHQYSLRAHLPMIAVNCAAIPEGLLESELFGHERGAFTNAYARRIGKFEQANRGTVFLDEIGDMAIATQAKILRVLEDGSLQRLGAEGELSVDVRVVAATHRDLEEEVQKGRFREDLYYRLNVVSVVLPPLRERKDDLPRLIEYFMARFGLELRLGPVTLSAPALARLIEHDWPGNIRELQNCLKDALLSCRGAITAEDVHLVSRPAAPAPGPADLGAATGARRHDAGREWPASSGDQSLLFGLDDAWLDTLEASVHAMAFGEFERRLLLYALRRCGHNQVRTALLLGISRSKLRDRLRRYQIASDKGP